MQRLILMAKAKAARLNDEQLVEEIARLRSGERKLPVLDERGKRVDIAPIILEVFKREQANRKKGGTK